MHEMKPAVDWKAVSLRRDPLTGNFIVENYLAPERSGLHASSPQREESGATAGRPASDKGEEGRRGLPALSELFFDLEDVVSRVTGEMQRSRVRGSPTSSKPKPKPASHLEKLERSFRVVYDAGAEMRRSGTEAETEEDEDNEEQEGEGSLHHRKEGAAPARDEFEESPHLLRPQQSARDRQHGQYPAYDVLEKPSRGFRVPGAHPASLPAAALVVVFGVPLRTPRLLSVPLPQFRHRPGKEYRAHSFLVSPI
ncbi:MAG: hypothetical protein BJ554DRAFT_6463 [Olpidium bornovanus]|uniref:Uncharacterized protein n=1 Tax=Olpidium bornovanus TaxID=278681 RepID=A0A8H7ZYK1_9FUNG|nr:MAG: hypothetical protein BJ554DRAFT_6463 [Olpidium bornovanus]